MIILNRLRVSRFKQLEAIDLRFPESGTVLIEGHNEAGKSSLFEAIVFALYGQTLINDRDYKIENLKQYGAEDMEVSLDFTVDGRAFNVTRRFGKRHSAKLLLPGGPDGEGEAITILTEIDKRLSEELHLSFDALLNTCFVEQKRLERLEDLNPSARQGTINELLNLKVLTRLQQEFKVSGEDRNALQKQKLRVGIAELDDEWPRLQQEAALAERCRDWASWRELEQSADEAQSQLKQIAEAERNLEQQRDEVGQKLNNIAQLRGSLGVLRGETSLSLQAWKESEARLEQLQKRIEELHLLQKELPALEEKNRESKQLAVRLELLEKAEQEAHGLEQEVRNARAALEERENLKENHTKNNRSHEQLKSEQTATQSTLEAAEAALENYRSCQRRINLLNLWNMRQEKQQSAREREEESAEKLRAVRSEAAQLETAEKRLAVLDEAQKQLVLLAQAKQKIVLEAKRSSLQNEYENAKKTLQKSEEVYAAAERDLQGARVRTALERWVKLRQELDKPAISPLEELATREQKAQQARETAAGEAEEKTRSRNTLLWAFSGAALIALIGGFVVNLLPIGGAIALVLIGIGAWLFSGASRAARLAEEERSRWNREIDALKGERRALELQAKTSSAGESSEAERELRSLSVKIPDSMQEARERLAKLPQVSLDAAREQLHEYESAVREARVQSGIAARALEEYESTLREDTSAGARLTREEWEDKQEAALAQIEQLSQEIAEPGLQAALKESLQNPDNSRLRTAAEAAQLQLNRAQEAARELPRLEQALAQAEAAHRLAARECAEVAGELGFCERAEADQKEEARTQLDQLQSEQGSTSEAELAERVSRTRSTLNELQSQISVLEVELQRQQQMLESVPDTELHSRLEELLATQKANKSTLDELHELRDKLRGRALPETHSALMASIASSNETIRHKQREVAQLEDAGQEQERAAERTASNREQFIRSWERVFPDSDKPAPAELESACGALPREIELLEAELAGYDEEELQNRQDQLQESLGEVFERRVTQQQQRDNLQRQIAQLRQQLGAEGNAPGAVEFLRAQPDLRCAPERTASQWEEAVQERRGASSHNRSARHTRAEAFEGEELSSETLLNLEAERERLRECEEAIDVKTRAGEIVEKTRASIVKRVMPLTMQNIRRLLPLLTENRYQDAEWDEEKNWILVYDTQARDLVRKRTFSGGARDQISLALRLAFALATLPSEHNTRPGFLFLDEPLSSFDRERTRALVDLLTRGLIRRQFQQIFLVSHSESFDPALFEYRLRLEGGRVVLNTLPT